jgi:FMN phosphatase YigB (HAD superfamily)
LKASNLMKARTLILLFDLGDTIMDEGTQVTDAGGTTLAAELIPGMADALRGFRATGHRLAIVADARPETPPNVLRQHGLLDLFETLAISEVVGATAGVTSIDKPDPRIFRAALDALGIPEADYGRVVMVGNNLERDIVGANRLGLISVFFHWNERRRTQPLTADEMPRYKIGSAVELTELITRIAPELGATTNL